MNEVVRLVGEVKELSVVVEAERVHRVSVGVPEAVDVDWGEEDIRGGDGGGAQGVADAVQVLGLLERSVVCKPAKQCVKQSNVSNKAMCLGPKCIPNPSLLSILLFYKLSWYCYRAPIFNKLFKTWR